MEKRARKRKSWARFNFHVCARLSIHCLYFIYARFIYVRTHVKITRQWKSTLTLVLNAVCWWILAATWRKFRANYKKWILATHKCNVVFQWHSNPLFLLTCSCLILPVKDTSLCSYISEFPFAQGLLSNTFDGLKSVNTWFKICSAFHTSYILLLT